MPMNRAWITSRLSKLSEMSKKSWLAASALMLSKSLQLIRAHSKSFIRNPSVCRFSEAETIPRTRSAMRRNVDDSLPLLGRKQLISKTNKIKKCLSKFLIIKLTRFHNKNYFKIQNVNHFTIVTMLIIVTISQYNYSRIIISQVPRYY